LGRTEMMRGSMFRVDWRPAPQRKEDGYSLNMVLLIGLQRGLDYFIKMRSYCLGLPASSKIRPVFHVSVLKVFFGTSSEVVANFPEELQDGQPVEQPLAICGTRVVLRNGRPDKQILLQWDGGSPEEASWE
ncbi:hypothetical protein Tco_0869909, partial [Tanacetum coccineum]